MAKLNTAQVLEIRRKWFESTIKSVERLGAEYNVSVSTISAIVKGKTWRKCGAESAEDLGECCTRGIKLEKVYVNR